MMTFDAFEPGDRVVQFLYPFADGGAVLYSPARQRWVNGGVLPAGWARPEPRLIEMLEARGLATLSPLGDAPPPERQPSNVAARGAIPWAIVALGSLLVLSATAEMRRRRAAIAR